MQNEQKSKRPTKPFWQWGQEYKESEETAKYLLEASFSDLVENPKLIVCSNSLLLGLRSQAEKYAFAKKYNLWFVSGFGLSALAKTHRQKREVIDAMYDNRSYFFDHVNGWKLGNGPVRLVTVEPYASSDFTPPQFVKIPHLSAMFLPDDHAHSPESLMYAYWREGDVEVERILKDGAA